jgi:hypothetical protein
VVFWLHHFGVSTWLINFVGPILGTRWAWLLCYRQGVVLTGNLDEDVARLC